MGQVTVKRVLMIAFHYPPVAGSSGVQRTLKFANYLLNHAWQPTVLTVIPGAYRKISNGQLSEIDENVRVIRCWALDAKRHLSMFGRYPGFLARPDSWSTWRYMAVIRGLAELRRQKHDLIWSTYPIATAHLIAAALHRRSRVPWVADFRDMMVDEGYPEESVKREFYADIERNTCELAARIVVTTPGTERLFEERYPRSGKGKLACIRNGYDEEDFSIADGRKPQRTDDKILLVHSGILYPSERDPRQFFEAVRDLRDAGTISASNTEIRLRATGHDDYHSALILKMGIEDIVRLEAGIAYIDALAEMMVSDGLLLFQASNCNDQVPAKVYEYFRAKKPILGLTDPGGDTAQLLKEAGCEWIAPLDEATRIADVLADFIAAIRAGCVGNVRSDVALRYSRRQQAAQLADLFDGIGGLAESRGGQT